MTPFLLFLVVFSGKIGLRRFSHHPAESKTKRVFALVSAVERRFGNALSGAEFLDRVFDPVLREILIGRHSGIPFEEPDEIARIHVHLLRDLAVADPLRVMLGDILHDLFHPRVLDRFEQLDSLQIRDDDFEDPFRLVMQFLVPPFDDGDPMLRALVL